MKFCLCSLFSILFLVAAAQEDTTDNTLETVIIKAFEQSRRQRDVAAAINYLDSSMLRRFSPSTIVQAVNNSPGVRMEERSPGSYRINIRGSALRSPFGVRNVKVYYNDLPITDPGGQTYLNALGFYNYQTLEIIKGPGSSLYGAGTGGVLSIESFPMKEKPSISAEVTAGNLGYRQVYAAVSLGEKAWKNKFSLQEQHSDGYRAQSASNRTILSWDGRYQSKTGHQLKTTFLYSHLFYQTPGALTETEYKANRRAARPAGGGFPGAEAAKASFNQQTFLGGISYNHRFDENFSGKLVGYVSSNRFRNPAIRNYGVNGEPHAGTRVTLQYLRQNTTSRLQLITGAELQRGNATVEVYSNRSGNPDVIQTADRIRTNQSLAFVQADYEWRDWLLTAGASLNFSVVRFHRFAPTELPVLTRRFNNEAAPRFSVARRLNKFTLYTSAGKGFSPPSTSELFPSGSAINPTLSAERGWNYEIGLRGRFGGLTVDVNSFRFSLQNMVVQRRDAGGGDYYSNAGSTVQQGIESSLRYAPWQGSAAFRRSLVWLSHTWHSFHYRDFKQVTTDYSGKQLPGVAPHSIAAGVNILSGSGFFGNLNYAYQSAIPLNDGNTAFAEKYHLVNAKVGVEKGLTPRWTGRLSVGADNIFGAQYSLGNDINAFGGRYYNAAPERTIYLSLAIQLQTGKQTPAGNNP